jgi:hypothetical protein
VRSVAGLLAAAALAAGCGAGDDSATITLPDYGTVSDFTAYVQPVLAAGCASLDCHGDPGRPLRLYSPNGLRQLDELRGEDESESEMTANMLSIAGLDPEAEQIEDHLLLLKPLAVAAGGFHHVGGDLWADESEPAYRCLHSWFRSGASDAEAQAVCQMAAP